MQYVQSPVIWSRVIVPPFEELISSIYINNAKFGWTKSASFHKKRKLSKLEV